MNKWIEIWKTPGDIITKFEVEGIEDWMDYTDLNILAEEQFVLWCSDNGHDSEWFGWDWR